MPCSKPAKPDWRCSPASRRASRARISFAFEVHDLAPLLARLDRSNVAIKEATDHPEELREINLTDPDGNRIRIFCWPAR